MREFEFFFLGMRFFPPHKACIMFALQSEEFPADGLAKCLANLFS